ncbi:MAG TPA: hypothetical protein VD994_07205 [Prosthecobacter sp.]|nr:hypothetical protein [Prosthecobacter sp.]
MRDTSISDQVRVTPEDKQPMWLPVIALRPGMRFELKAGQTVPVASRLLGSQAAVSLEWINGESEAQTRDEGQLLPSGALNIGVRQWQRKRWKAGTPARCGACWKLAAAKISGTCGWRNCCGGTWRL